jgi:ribosomal protein S18 acetylase RimI-like enzyme
MSDDELDLDPGALDTDHVLVRTLEEKDLDAITEIDRKVTGRSRREYYALKVRAALEETGVKVSLVAELEGRPVGFLMGQVFYGEFGQPEPVAVIDSIGVDPDQRHRKVGKALLRQLVANLGALRIETIQTQVDWDHWELLQFFAREGFRPAPRIALERRL